MNANALFNLNNPNEDWVIWNSLFGLINKN